MSRVSLSLLALLLCGCEVRYSSKPLEQAPASTAFEEDDHGVTILRYPEFGVTCWRYARWVGNGAAGGISCLPDSQLRDGGTP